MSPTADQINNLRDSFRRAMLDWDVVVSVKIEDLYADVDFHLWGTRFEGTFTIIKNTWATLSDCPHEIKGSISVWQWIAMKLHEKITA